MKQQFFDWMLGVAVVWSLLALLAWLDAPPTLP